MTAAIVAFTLETLVVARLATPFWIIVLSAIGAI